MPRPGQGYGDRTAENCYTLRRMFGLGAGELILIAVLALLFLGPERLPGAAKALGRTIRDLRRHTRDLQTTLEQDSDLGDAVRDLKSALRGDDYAPAARRPPGADPAKHGGEPATSSTETEGTEPTSEDTASETEDSASSVSATEDKPVHG